MQNEAERVGSTTLSRALTASLGRLTELRKAEPVRENLPVPVKYLAPAPVEPSVTKKQLVNHLLALETIFPGKALTEAQSTVRYQLFYDALQRQTAPAVDLAFKRYRESPSEFMPTPGQILALCKR